jgi:hypothetical protein
LVPLGGRSENEALYDGALSERGYILAAARKRSLADVGEPCKQLSGQP